MPVMPDTRIALSGLSSGGDRPSTTSPLQTIGAMMQIKEQQQAYEARRLENEARRRQLEDDDEMSNALTQFARPEDAIDHLWTTGKAGAAANLTKDVLGARTQQWQEADARLKLTGNRLEHASQLLGGVTAEGPYQTVRPQLVKILEPEYGAAINDILPTQYDEAKVKQLVQAGTSRAQQIQQQRDLVDNHIKLYAAGAESALELGKYMPELKGPDGTLNPNVAKWSRAALEAQDGQRELLNRTLLTATSKDQYDAFLKTAFDNGVQKAVLDDTPPWIEDPKERHARLTMAGLSMKERGSLESASRRSADAEQRIIDAEGRAQDAERRRDQTAAGRGQLTPAQRYNEEDANQKEVQETEKWLKDAYDTLNKKDKTAPPTKDAKGKEVRSADYDDLGGYAIMAKARETDPTSKLAALGDEYIHRRVAAENKNRQRLQNLPPIEVAAKQAVAQKDQATYDKLEKVYKGVTNGVGRLDEVVPWIGRTPGASSVLAEKDRVQLRSVLDKLKDPALSPADRKALEAQRDQLVSRR